jgi:hypothetical protein
MNPIVCHLCCLAALVVLVGCSGRDLPDLGEVHGKVTLDGKPLPNANVSFDPVEKGRSSFALTDAEGNYALRYGADVNGAKLGKYNVRIWTYQKGGDEPGSPKEIPEMVPEKYLKPGAITKDVTEEDNVFDIELTSK